jgi:S1-C subfamily serine protease
VRFRALLTLVIALGCRAEAPPPQAPAAPALASARPAPDRPPHGALFRDDVDRAVELGLGSFLQHVRVEAVLNDGRFVGWEIVELVPPELFASVDLKPGDVVTQVNGMPIERELEAFNAFQSLRQASELRVKRERGGEPGELVLRIIPRGAPPASSATPVGSAPPASSAKPVGSAPPASSAPVQ